jgi:ABC-2 type transport system permease protein
MTTSTTTAGGPATGPAGRVLTLAMTELRLMVRNRTVAVSAILLPLGLGLFWAYSFSGDDPRTQAVVVALQLAVVLGMGIYVTATQTLVARRQARVLKRMRTSAVSDTGLLVATVAPAVALGVAQLVVFGVIDAFAGVPAPAEPLWLVVAVLGGIALAVTAALATAVVTPSPERAQITTLPLTFVLLGSAITMSVLPSDGWWQALVVVPGAAIGALLQMAMTGGAWGTDPFGVPSLLFPLLAVAAWPQLFAWFARRRFRWDPRH